VSEAGACTRRRVVIPEPSRTFPDAATLTSLIRVDALSTARFSWKNWNRETFYISNVTIFLTPCSWNFGRLIYNNFD